MRDEIKLELGCTIHVHGMEQYRDGVIGDNGTPRFDLSDFVHSTPMPAPSRTGRNSDLVGSWDR
jgi:hypothetical protein